MTKNHNPLGSRQGLSGLGSRLSHATSWGHDLTEQSLNWGPELLWGTSKLQMTGPLTCLQGPSEQKTRKEPLSTDLSQFDWSELGAF